MLKQNTNFKIVVAYEYSNFSYKGFHNCRKVVGSFRLFVIATEAKVNVRCLEITLYL